MRGWFGWVALPLALVGCSYPELPALWDAPVDASATGDGPLADAGETIDAPPPIIDASPDAAWPTISWDPTEPDGHAPEGDGSGFLDFGYQIVLSAPSSSTVTVELVRTGDATKFDADVMPTDSITLTPGDVSEVVIVRVHRDDNGGGGDNEDTVIMTLTSPTNATLGSPTVRSHVIGDDD